MTRRATRLALIAALALALPPAVSRAQFGRGGMVGNRANFGGGRPNIGFNPGGFNQNNFNRQNNANFGNINNNRTVVNNINVVNAQNRGNFNLNARPGLGRPGYGYGGGFGGYGGYGGGAYRGWGGSGYGLGYGGGPRAGSYYASHASWINGSWGGNFRPGWGGYPGYGGINTFGNSALGVGSAVGIAAWGVGSLVNSFGYSRYTNPYYGAANAGYLQQPAAVVQALPYDYSRPLDLAMAPPASAAQTSAATLDQARNAFIAGDTAGALALADRALAQTPNDPMLHEFRAVCLFALRRYDEAAVPLYTVLSAGPGWDWTTMLGLYPTVEVYTAQLRALEAYCNASPRAASARFVLAALYLTQGSTDAAATRLREVVALQPQDRLSAQLLAAIATPANPGPPPATATPAAAATATAAAPPLPSGPVPAGLVGPWTATPAQGVAIALNLDRDGRAFTWKVDEKGQAREFRGEAGFDTDSLALLAPEMPPMVARVTWKDASHFNFRILGASADDPGLDFAR